MLELRKMMPHVVLAAAFVIFLQPVYFFAMANVDRVLSHEKTWEHIREAFDSGILGGVHAGKKYINGGDRFTDCYSLGEGLQPEADATIRGIIAARPASEHHACDDLRDAATSPTSANWSQYARYWHGYRLYSAPLASAAPILILKLINLALLAVSTLAFFFQTSKLIGRRETLLLCAPVLFCSDFVRIWQVTPHTVSTAVIVGGSAIFALALRRQCSASALILLAAAFGSVFNFVDFLVNPPWMPMLLAFFIMASGRDEAVRTAMICIGAWFSAYSFTWGSKWVFAHMVDPSFDIRSDVLTTMIFRIGGDNAKVLHIPLAATIKVFGNSLVSWGTPLFGTLLFFCWKKIEIINFDRHTFARRAWPALIPVFWFEILSNHSQIHAFFVSRSAAAAVGIILSSAAMAALIRVRPNAADLSRRNESLTTR